MEVNIQTMQQIWLPPEPWRYFDYTEWNLSCLTLPLHWLMRDRSAHTEETKFADGDVAPLASASRLSSE
ncbi:hypothetical protein AV929_08695 [Haloarcula sp. K1]|nr:hypothetical protein AV929_08695 [Haloarcula sp. K1]